MGLFLASEGERQRLRVYLENIVDRGRSKTYTVESTDRTVTFCPDDYQSIRTVREKGGRNGFHAVLETPDHVFTSEGLDLMVGIQLLLVADSKKATLAAMIDHSTDPRVYIRSKGCVTAKEKPDSNRFWRNHCKQGELAAEETGFHRLAIREDCVSFSAARQIVCSPVLSHRSEPRGAAIAGRAEMRLPRHSLTRIRSCIIRAQRVPGKLDRAAPSAYHLPETVRVR